MKNNDVIKKEQHRKLIPVKPLNNSPNELIKKNILRKQNKNNIIKTKNVDKFKEKIDKYLKQIANGNFKYIIFMFSGTTYVQELRGNRPIKLTKALLEMNVPVFFSYWRWHKYEKIPSYSDNRLFQSPIDKTLEYMDEIIKFNFKDKKKIFVVSFPYPYLVRIVNQLNMNGWVTIYDVRDDWEEFHKVKQAKWFDINAEKYIVNNCDIVCAVSRPLQRKIQNYTKNKIIQLSPNAFDSKFIKDSKIKIAPRDGKAVIGYFGHLTNSWFDWESLIKIAKLKTNWTFEIIGHHIPNNLNLPSNIKYMEPKIHNEIREITKKWRVAIIPFKIGKLSNAVDPIKVYEYLGLGLPVVSFRMPQIHDYPYVFIANNVNEFILQIQKALTVSMDIKVIEKFLANNRWENRAKQFLIWGNKTLDNPDLIKLISRNNRV